MRSPPVTVLPSSSAPFQETLLLWYKDVRELMVASLDGPQKVWRLDSLRRCSALGISIPPVSHFQHSVIIALCIERTHKDTREFTSFFLRHLRGSLPCFWMARSTHRVKFRLLRWEELIEKAPVGAWHRVGHSKHPFPTLAIKNLSRLPRGGLSQGCGQAPFYQGSRCSLLQHSLCACW